jgi:predicted O-linked N-acetylglucosamine transferase (SPINDLY family)
LHRHAEALASFDRALALDPDHAIAHYNRGITLGNMKRYEEALTSHNRALILQPDYVAAHNHRGAMLRELGHYQEALSSYERALELDPHHLSSIFNRGNLLVKLSRIEDAVRNFSELVTLAPDYDYAQGYLLQAKKSCCDWLGLSAPWSAISEGVRQGKKSVEPFFFLSMSSSPDLQKRCAEIYTAGKFSPVKSVLFASKPRKSNKIRLGYVAGEFRRHALSTLIAGLIEGHDTSCFEVFAFDNGWDDGSDIRQRLENAFTEIVDISRLGDIEAASEIRDRSIDILIDLNAHSGFKRTGIFSHRPAPIQVNWLGYPGTMGAPFMDYIIGDAIVIPAGHEAYYSENVVRLPDTYQVNDSRRAVSAPTPTRAEAGLPDTAYVFCCFNNNHKITPEVFDIWMHLLNQVQHSVLWLLADNDAAARNLRYEAAARGVAPERLVFAPRLTLPDHLARHRLADLFLDTLPYNAHTTANDALWMGVPLLTCMGHTFSGRVASSLLHAVGLPELITENLADYEAMALKLATTPTLLSDLRTRLTANRTTHPLFDSDRFRLHIESAYATMYKRWVRGEAPQGFNVNPVTIA